MEKEVIEKNFLQTKVRLVKSDGFVIWGEILGCYNNGIMFFTDGKTIFISYESIGEISPLGGNHGR